MSGNIYETNAFRLASNEFNQTAVQATDELQDQSETLLG